MTEKVFCSYTDYTHNRRMKTNKQNTGGSIAVFIEFCKLIPKYSLANVYAELNQNGIKIAARSFSVWSHIISMIYCHMAHVIIH